MLKFAITFKLFYSYNGTRTYTETVRGRNYSEAFERLCEFIATDNQFVEVGGAAEYAHAQYIAGCRQSNKPTDQDDQIETPYKLEVLSVSHSNIYGLYFAKLHEINPITHKF